MRERRSMKLHYSVRASILAALSGYIVHLVKVDKLQLYLLPRMMIYVKLGAMALFALAVFYVFLVIHYSNEKHEKATCDCGDEPPRSTSGNVLLYGLFAIPLLLGFALPDAIMASDVASIKGMNLNAASMSQAPASSSTKPAVEKPAAEKIAEGKPPIAEKPARQNSGTPAQDELDKLFPADEYSIDLANLGKKLYGRKNIHVGTEGFLELLTMLDMYKDNFKGKEISISGFVYREEDMDKDEIIVSRMAVQCCSADAIPYGVLVKSKESPSLKKDTWVSLTGILTTSKYKGNEIVTLDANKIKVIQTPGDPYVYSYFGDLDKLAVE